MLNEQLGHVLLTGGTGFFGSAILNYLVNLYKVTNCVPKVTVLTRSPKAFLSINPEFQNHAWLKFHEGNLLAPKTYPSEDSFTHIIHAAADSTLGHLLSPIERFRQIVDGTGSLLQYAVENQIHRFLLVSSGGVYGPQPEMLNMIPESFNGMADPLNANNAYSVSKRAAEHLCALYQYQYGVQTVIARCFSFVGVHLPLDAHFAIGNFIRDALFNKEIDVIGDGAPIRTYMDERDLAEWLLVLTARGRAGEAYNVGSDQPITILELAQLVRDLVSSGKVINIQKNASYSNQRNRYVPSIEKAKLELGLDIRYSLCQGIKSTAEAAKQIMKRVTL